MADARVNDLDQELFSELTETLVQPLLIHGLQTEKIQTTVYKSTGTFYGNGGRWKVT